MKTNSAFKNKKSSVGDKKYLKTNEPDIKGPEKKVLGHHLLNPAKELHYENKIKETGGPNQGNKAGDNMERIAASFQKNRLGFGERNELQETVSLMKDGLSDRGHHNLGSARSGVVSGEIELSEKQLYKKICD
jgi:hypothetical protein